MKQIVIFIVLISSLGFSQTTNELEVQIKGLLYDYGTFMVEGTNTSSNQQKVCSVTFNNRVVSIKLTHSNHPTAIQIANASDPWNSVVDSGMYVQEYTFNIDNLKHFDNGTFIRLLQQVDKHSTTLYVKAAATYKAYYVGESHHKNDVNKKVKVYASAFDNIPLYNKPGAEGLMKSISRDLIQIPVKPIAYDQDWFKNTLNRLFTKYLTRNTDITYEYGENGTTTSMTHWQNGLRHGQQIFFYESGGPKLVETWMNGKRTGFLDQFLSDGTQILKNGNGVHMTFHKNGVKEYEAEYIEGKRAGKASWYYDNGQVIESAIYKYNPEDHQGFRWEIVSSFHKDGTPRDKGTLKEGNGTWFLYGDNGKLEEVLQYKNGIQVK
ncbi:antitoxin component YwqK of YwqJK toxin-antitoxin module [Ulvibacter sp. MAR_2010_11]|uniref:toxin-antitoxin system YwqK family antitoxin n=1 Tax=Ulvibacter sp. MAR_2010_11 TaxID=1250229 RepID=UPI000C2C8E2B|nr:hypothetical protein [Ulvibacter sp. MAR_2010_11]PKA82014.1 antitoxin component YwqK of YwqJK toxin-antitoxin module [Ulvibacter sp. MAR_2010_11]